MDNTLATATDWETECKRARAECDERAKMCEELHEKVRCLEMENAELKAHIDVIQGDAKYTVGLVDGLKFAIRCNGVSGGEVKE